MKQSGRGYDVLVALPLAFVTIFCFVFVMIHPYYKAHPATATAIVTNSKTPSSPSAAVVDLTSSLPQLTTVPVPTTPSPTATMSTNVSASSSVSLSSPAKTKNSSTQASLNLVQSSNTTAGKLQPSASNKTDVKITAGSAGFVSQLLDSLSIK